MKKEIHPEYKTAKITCGCGNVIETKNTAGDLTVEICSACHPFFTGKQKLLDTAGRVDKFRARMETANALKNSKAKIKKKKAEAPTSEGAGVPTKSVGKKTDTTNIDKKMEEIKEELKEETVDIKPEKKDETTDEK